MKSMFGERLYKICLMLLLILNKMFSYFQSWKGNDKFYCGQ